MKHTFNVSHLIIALACLLTGGILLAQTGGIQRSVALRADVSHPNHEVFVVVATLSPGTVAEPHTHPGDEITYVLEGEGELSIEGEPTRKVKAGDAFIVPAGKVHGGKNTGTVPYRVIASYIVEKNKPLATLVPAAGGAK